MFATISEMGDVVLSPGVHAEQATESPRAAGAIILAKDTKRILLGQRGTHGDYPLTWATIGGNFEPGEGPRTACRREIFEETGYGDHISFIPLMLYQKGDFRYYNYLAIVPWEFEAVRCDENNALTWFEYNDWPQPQHPGFEKLLANDISMHTLLTHVYGLHLKDEPQEDFEANTLGFSPVQYHAPTLR